MYSPKIDATLIPSLYWLAQARGMPMTRLVNACLRAMLDTPAAQHDLATLRSRLAPSREQDEATVAPTTGRIVRAMMTE